MLLIKRQFTLLVPAVALMALPLFSGCDTIECGPGTFEDDGTCVVGDGFDTDDPRCGAGTSLVGGECVPDFDPTECDDTTTAPEVQPDGTTICVGTGGGGCGSISCGDAGGGNFVSLCGQILDVETNLPIRADDATGQPCDPLNSAADGPCALKVEFFDALGFAANPTGTEPQAADVVEINDCGHFKGIRVERPFSGQIAIGINNSDGAGAPDVKLLSGIAITTEMGELRKDLRAFVITAVLDQAWTDTAGNPFGDATFVDKGVYAPVFCAPDCATGTPATGVQVTRGGAVVAGDDYYFSDTDANARTTVDAAQSSTGANGAALMVNSSLGQHSGAGGESAGCEWQGELAASVPTALFFRESFSHAPGDDATPCPE